MSLSPAADDACDFNHIRYIMDFGDNPRASLGKRLFAAVVPRYFKDAQELHRRTTIAYPTVHKWKKGTANPKWEQVEKVAEVVRRDPFDLIADPAGARTALANHPEFPAALAGAKTKYKGKLPEGAYLLAASTHSAQWPDHLDAYDVYSLAEFWNRMGTDHELITAETETARAEAQALRAGRMP